MHIEHNSLNLHDKNTVWLETFINIYCSFILILTWLAKSKIQELTVLRHSRMSTFWNLIRKALCLSVFLKRMNFHSSNIHYTLQSALQGLRRCKKQYSIWIIPFFWTTMISEEFSPNLKQVLWYMQKIVNIVCVATASRIFCIWSLKLRISSGLTPILMCGIVIIIPLMTQSRRIYEWLTHSCTMILSLRYTALL